MKNLQGRLQGCMEYKHNWLKICKFIEIYVDLFIPDGLELCIFLEFVDIVGDYLDENWPHPDEPNVDAGYHILNNAWDRMCSSLEDHRCTYPDLFGSEYFDQPAGNEIF